ncbi:cuticle protein 7-like [Oratosquilla oratoria]|uniref:cuticle protein 7-like n=1 Tax=Oratosquilla oratoria TaxID=337810 RepID=UPI003F7759DC
MDFKLVLLLALAAVALARPQDDDFPPASYKFEYSVKDEESGNDFGQNEAREGDNTEGSYRVVLPDGKELVVSYTVNADGGFIADATIDGVPLHQV